MPATSSIAVRNSASLALDGLLNPVIFLTNCSEAARTSSSVTGGSKLKRGLMFLHMGFRPRKDSSGRGLASASGSCGGAGEPLARVAAPRACGIESNVGLPVPLRFVARAELFANKCQVVVGVGITRIETHGVAKMQSRRFQPADFF